VALNRRCSSILGNYFSKVSKHWRNTRIKFWCLWRWCIVDIVILFLASKVEKEGCRNCLKDSTLKSMMKMVLWIFLHRIWSIRLWITIGLGGMISTSTISKAYSIDLYIMYIIIFEPLYSDHFLLRVWSTVHCLFIVWIISC